ncbi:MAG TPA: hypothetical protein VIY51_27970 [Xanthobacteraceae bacterium]
MRAMLSNILMSSVWVVGLCAALGWGYLSWGIDFGRSFRDIGLWWLVFSVGSCIAFLVGAGLVAFLHMWLFPEDRK